MLTFISGVSVGARSIYRSDRRLRLCSTSSPTVCSVSLSNSVSRREALQISIALFTTAVFPTLPTYAETANSVDLGEPVRDDLHGFEYRPPSEGWSQQSATLSSARVATIYIRDADGDSNVNVVTTPVSSDYQVLTSFGGLDKVVSTLVPPKRNGVEGSLIEAKTDDKNKAYVVEYNVTSRGVTRHLLTVFSLQPSRYLITLTAQAREENWHEVEPVVRAVMDSYKLTILD